ncbi:MAG TPA: sensor domain-containing protein [Thermoanaerobaculia bacterium]|nr:sensor domain-containing protein [Thermoanaerobaculia bacterium]
METNARDAMTFTDALIRFFTAPFRVRTYTNLLYLMLAFPMGLIYFIFLTVGLCLGLGLTIIWIGVPILALVFAGSWGLAAMERQLAIHALGAEVPPMTPPPVSAAQTFWQRAGAFFSNPVTWKGMAFLLVKLPLGVVSFAAVVSLLATSAALILTPIAWQWGDLFYFDGIYIDGIVVDTWISPWFAGLLGVGLLFLSFNLLNGLALVWRWTATSLLGSERFAAAAPSPEMPDAVALA